MASQLSNPWIGYSARDYETIRTSYIAGLSVPANGLTEITDYSDSNPLIKDIGIFSALGEMIAYWIDNKARETFLSTVRLLENAIYIARSFDYKVQGKIAASGTLTFTLSETVGVDVTMLAGSQCADDNESVIVELTEDLLIEAGELEATVSARQWETGAFVNLGNSTGAADQVFTVGADVAEGSMVVRIGASTFFTEVTTFSDSGPDDDHFMSRLNKDGDIEIVFGDGVNGAIPATSQSINVKHSTTQGSEGNFGIGLITQFLDNPSSNEDKLSVTNTVEFTGGRDEETVADIQSNIPKRLRTLDRAVSEQDYTDVSELTPGVEKTKAQFNCGKAVKIYVVPEGGGTASQTLLDDVEEYMYDKRMVTTAVEPVAAGSVSLLMRWKLGVKSGYSKTLVSQDVRDTIIAYFAASNQEIGGAVRIGDMYEIVEAVPGVSWSENTFFGVKPFAKNIKSNPANKSLSWTVTPLEGITNSLWRFLFVSGSSFQVIKDGDFKGTYAINNTVTLDFLTFKVNANQYVAGDKFEFRTYGINTNIVLDEQSLFTVAEADIQLTTEGGF